MKPLTAEQKEQISLILFEVFNRPELLPYMRNQLTDNFWKAVSEVENGIISSDAVIDFTHIR